jgi:acid phosphatase type 7
LTVGDNVYPDGRAVEFANCYAPSWGRFKQRTRPSPGNHDYHTSAAAAYFAYFGPVAGKPGQGWYAYDLGTWRIYALNSNCPEIGGCGTTSAQYAWLQADLAANARRCVAAYWHHPRFSSGPHGPSTRMSSILQRLYDAGADVVLAGHDHLYERFAPMTPTGAADATRGIRHFTAGMGGAPLYEPESTAAPNSQLIEADTHGVLKLTLGWSAYEWEFVAANGDTFTDRGNAGCH